MDGANLRRRLKSIELKDGGRVGAAIGYVREVREWLDHVEKSIETKGPALHILPRLGELERSFHSGVKDRAEYVATILDWLSECRIRQEEIRYQRVQVGREDRFPKVAGLGIVGAAKTNPRHDGKPAEICVRVEELVKGIETDGAVILKT